jgi:hypothetical protein
VDTRIGFLAAVQDRRMEAVSMARVRYNLPTEMLSELSQDMLRAGQLRVDARGLRAEVDVAPFRV